MDMQGVFGLQVTFTPKEADKIEEMIRRVHLVCSFLSCVVKDNDLNLDENDAFCLEMLLRNLIELISNKLDEAVSIRESD